MAQFCSKCGNPLPEGMTFCIGCGAPVARPEAPVAQPWSPNPPVPPMAPLPGGERMPPLTTPTYTLFDSKSVGLATLLGSPVAGTLLMAVNYRRLGKGSYGAAAVAIGVVVTVLAAVFGNLIPAAFSTAVAIGLLLVTISVSQTLQGPVVAQHVSQGGKLGSRWAASGIGISLLAVIGGGVFLAILGRQLLSQGSKVTFGAHDAVFYSGSATEADAQLVGEKLKTIGYFTDRGANVLLSKDKGDAVVSFVVKAGSWNRQEMISAFEEIGGSVAPALGRDTIKVRMVDQSRETKLEMTAGSAIIGTKDEIFYSGSATQSDANALGHALIAAGYLVDNGASVLLSKGDGTVISLVVSDSAFEKPENIVPYENTVRKVASYVGGLPIKLRLLNSSLAIKKEVVVQ